MTWSTATLDQLTVPGRSILYGVVKPGDRDDTNGVLFIRGGDIRDGRIAVDELRTITRSVSDQYKRTLLRGGELLVSLVGNPGAVAMVPDGLTGANIARQAGLIALNDDVDHKYVEWFLRSPDGQAAMGVYVKGAVQQVINLSVLKQVSVRLPPLPTQRRIASILSAYDDLIENNTRRIAILEEMARRLYDEWFVQFRFPGHEGVPMVDSEIGKVPQGWEVVRLEDVAAFIGRGISPKYDDEADCRVINQKCILYQRLNMDLSRRQSKNVRVNKVVRFGDVLINSTGVGTLGRVAQVYEPLENTTVDSHVTIARAEEAIDLDYFGQQLLSLQPHFEGQGVGATGQTELSRGRVAETSFIQPPCDLQEQFGDIVRPMKSLCTRLAAKNTNLRTQRDLLLPKLISGEIDVSEVGEPSEEAAA